MASNNRSIAAMLTAGMLGDQSAKLGDDQAREALSQWVVATYRTILRDLDATEPEDEERTSLGFSPR